MSISHSQRLLAFYNDQCPVVNSTGVLYSRYSFNTLRGVGNLARPGSDKMSDLFAPGYVRFDLPSEALTDRSVLPRVQYCFRQSFIPLACALKRPEQRQSASEAAACTKLMWAESMISRSKRVN